ncbi:tetratricopeptide repeat protein [candidate division KSB3 bacterium]|jgi:tetratricopeptide (TPR) repeat protein|uniref:Tetratricopeptide repeat protein n=1 Tax=candidate division KSB3 bacterium TaxID=2044937 RepID=A0A9D5JZ01_9BACT|nr:tetratricopeptide repeat protein [candidate division KSB3 bacterium]MBD3326351.1 tetratricopeptide repeat protein [candidate division KSB3 bacterium]
MTGVFIKRKIRKYEKRLAAHANDPEYIQDLADLYVQISQPDKARTYYQQAIETYYQRHSRLGEDTTFILDVCGKLLEIDPLNLLAHETLGQEYCSLGEFDDALKLYTAFARKLVQAGQYAKAIEQYRHVLVLTPHDIEIRQQCFSLLWKLRKKNEAIQELEKIAELAERQGNLVKAVECYRKAVKIMPSNSRLQAELSRVSQLTRTLEKPLRLVVNK